MGTKIVSIRCAHQKYNDFNVELDVRWTVQQLKRHLSEIYPSNPAVDSQRLIFAGQLMKDSVLVSDYLSRLPETDQSIVHLVCKIDPASATLLASSTAPSDDTFLRQRRVAAPLINATPTPVVDNSSSSFQAGVPFPAVQSMPNMFGLHHAWSFNSQQPSPASNVHLYSPYAHAYMNQYFQYLQQLYGQGVHTHLAAMAPPGNDVAAVPPVAQNNVPQAQAAAPVALNAQGGVAMEDEDGARPNDWLDWAYTVFRASFLFLVLFSYSSAERMVFIVVVGLLLYAYHNGWFSRRGRRLNNDGNNNPVPALPANPPRTDPHSEQQATPTTANRHDSAWHVFWATCYTFVSSFFASLIPEHPQAAGANF